MALVSGRFHEKARKGGVFCNCQCPRYVGGLLTTMGTGVLAGNSCACACLKAHLSLRGKVNTCVYTSKLTLRVEGSYQRRLMKDGELCAYPVQNNDNDNDNDNDNLLIPCHLVRYWG